MTPHSDESGEEMKQELENRIQPSTECEYSILMCV